jgi:hypothetical protein
VGDGCGRVDSETDFLAQGANGPDQLRDAVAKLNVNVHLIGACFGKGFQENFRLGTHEVDVEEHPGQWTDGLHDRGTEGDVLDEVAVHDVEVQPIGSRSISAPRFLFQASEIRGEQRRRNIHVRGQYRLERKVKSPKSDFASFCKALDRRPIFLVTIRMHVNACVRNPNLITMKKSLSVALLAAGLLVPGLASAQLIVFKGASSDAYIGEGRTWRIASKSILVVDYSTGNFGRIDYTTFLGQKHYSTATYTNAHSAQVTGLNGKSYTAVTRIPTDCDQAENPNREGLYFSGSNSTLTIISGAGGITVTFPKSISGSGRGFFYSNSTGQPVISQGALLGVFSLSDSQARNQAGDTLDSAMAGYISYVQGLGYTN